MKTFKNGASQSWSWRCGRWLAADDHMSKGMMKKDAMIKGTMGKDGMSKDVGTQAGSYLGRR